MLSMKSVASALVLVASAADTAVPVLIVPALVLGVSTAARAQVLAPSSPTEAVRHQVVRYDDLNLASADGRAIFQVRLKGAVETVCGPQADLRNFDEAADYKACVAKATEDAVSAVPDIGRTAARPVHRIHRAG